MGRIQGPPDRSIAGNSKAIISPAYMPGLIGYWRMEEASWDGTAGEVIDSSGRGNHGVAVNGVSTIASGKIGRCGDFDKASGHYVSIPAAFPGLSAVTFAAWIYPTMDDNDTILGGSGTFIFRKDITTKEISMYSTLSTGAVFSDSAVSLNEFSQVLFVWDGIESWFHINGGAREGVVPNTGTLTIPTPMLIGRQTAALAVRDFDGRIDEVKIFNRALSQTEIDFLYRSGAGRIIK